jgi:hypothetical protein
MKPLTLTAPIERAIFTAALVLSFLALTFAVYSFLPVGVNWSLDGPLSVGVDWKGAFRPATLEMIAGRTPYGHGAYNPPWALLPLIPFALLPPALGAAVVFVLGLFMFGFSAHRFGAPAWLVVMFALSFPVLGNSWNGNLDWMVALGCTLPPQIGLLLVLTKPQLGAGIALFWLIEAFRRGGLRETVRVFAPVGIAYLVSFALYGLWPLNMVRMGNSQWNGSLWPVGVAIGAPLLVSAIRSRNPDLAITSSPFLAPYISGHGWSIALFGLIRRPAVCAAAILAMWIVKILA